MLFGGCLTPSNLLVYLRDGSAQTIVHAATLRWKLQIKLSISPSHSILTLVSSSVKMVQADQSQRSTLPVEGILSTEGENCDPSKQHIDGFRPEWYILTIYHCRDIPFWSETLDMVSAECDVCLACILFSFFNVHVHNGALSTFVGGSTD